MQDAENMDKMPGSTVAPARGTSAQRRCALWCALAAALTLQACRPAATEAPTSAAASAATLSPEQQRYQQSVERMRSKFGPIGFELVVDAMKGEEFLGVDFYPEHSELEYFGSGIVALKSKSTSSRRHVPERVRIVWREDGYKRLQNAQGNYVRVGKILGDEVIEVGSRIPQAVIDDLRRDPKGVLRLKFRMHREGTLFGWDIERRPGYDPTQRDVNGNTLYVAPVHSMADGDFREAGIFNGKAVRMGWYIDKKTGQKIEIDF
jgi:hypothetical protein